MAPTVARIEAALADARHSESGRSPARHATGLSPREVEILRLVARGLTNAEIGERLFISAHTVARHIQNVLEKTGLANRTEATAFAFRQGIIGD
jgi:DNA-binding NarL/FixJ family response regulator